MADDELRRLVKRQQNTVTKRDGSEGVGSGQRWSKAGLYGCLSCDCAACFDRECTPGAQRVSVEKARQLGWVG